MFDTFNCISSIEYKRWMLRLNIGSNNDCSRTGGPLGPSPGSANQPPPPPRTIHKHLHPSTITQNISTTTTPTGMFTLYCLMFPADTKSYAV